MTMFAQFSGDGYYRVQNVGSKRYVCVEDDKGSINVSATSVEMGAVVLWKKFERVVSNPASIIYIKKVGTDTDYDLYAQGTSTYGIIGYHVDVYPSPKTAGAYRVYGSQAGMTKWLCDGERSSVPDGALSDNDQGKTNYSDWYMLPLSQDDERFFGITPDVEVNGKYYAAFYADFPFSFASSGMKAYYVSATTGAGLAKMEEITGTIPAATPVIIECSSDEPANNKLNIFASDATAPTNNMLKGVYFCNTTIKHKNLTPYNAETMRVLGKMSDGSLGFVTASIENLPANKSYLSVSAHLPAEIKLLTAKDFSAGVSGVGADRKAVTGIYTTTGVKISDDASQLNTLQRGIYIVDGQKVIIR